MTSPVDKPLCLKCIHTKVGLLPNRREGLRVAKTWQHYCDLGGERVVLGDMWEIQDSSIVVMSAHCRYQHWKDGLQVVADARPVQTESIAVAPTAKKPGYSDVSRLADPSQWKKPDQPAQSTKDLAMAQIKEILAPLLKPR